MSFLAGIFGQLLKALLGFFQESREADKNRQQLEKLAKEAELNRAELQRARETLDVTQNREKIDATVRDLSNDDLIGRLRNSARNRPTSAD